MPHLRRLLEAGESTPTERLYLRMALLAVDRDQIAPLQTALLHIGAGEQRQVLSALEPYRDEVVAGLWKVVENESAPLDERFHAAAALAQVDAPNARWTGAAPLVAGQLADNHAIVLSEWAPAFRPVREVLIPPLLRAFHGATEAHVRARVAGVLADYARDRPAVLAELYRR